MRLAVVMQFHKGDVAAALCQAGLIARMQKEPDPNVVFILFAARNVEEIDPVILAPVLRELKDKFETHVWRGERRGDGYPHGPNDMWYEVNQRIFEEVRNDRLKVDTIFTIESDTCPTQADWISQLMNEYEGCGKDVLGCITQFMPGPEGLHVNGNLVLPVGFCFKYYLVSCPATVAWDVFHRKELLRSSHHSKLIWNEYKCSEAKMDQYLGNPSSLPVILHGYKGSKLRDFLYKKINP